MLVGSADLARMAARAPCVEHPATEPLTLEGVEILQILYEVAASGIDAAFPAALHPTIPPIASFLFFRVSGGPLGAFQLAQLRLGCRSGVRPRALLVGAFVDGTGAGSALSAGWGFATRPATVALRRRYDEIVGTVEIGGATVLDVRLRDPDMISQSDVQYTANMNPARLGAGLRLMQVDPEFRVHRAERGRPEVLAFDADAWGEKRIRPTYPVSASFTIADVVLPRVRFVCRPDVLAFEGTEKVAD